MRLKVDYDNQKCRVCQGPLERLKRTNKPICKNCQRLRTKELYKLKKLK